MTKDLKLQSEKRELKVGDNLGTLYGEGEPVQMKVTQTAIDTLERLDKEFNLDEIDDRIVCSTSPREVQMIMNFQKEKESYANTRVLEELEIVFELLEKNELMTAWLRLNSRIKFLKELKEVKQP
jgi:hypothetical protein